MKMNGLGKKDSHANSKEEELKEISLDKGKNMKLKLMQSVLAIAAIVIFTLATPTAFAQKDTTPGKPTVGGQMKEGGKEVGKAGKSLGHNIRRGRLIRGGKHFGKHLGHAGRHVGRGTKRAVKRAVKP